MQGARGDLFLQPLHPRTRHRQQHRAEREQQRAAGHGVARALEPRPERRVVLGGFLRGLFLCFADVFARLAQLFGDLRIVVAALFALRRRRRSLRRRDGFCRRRR